MPNEHIRPLDPSVFQCSVYLANPERARVFRTGFAPTNSRVVIRTNLSKSRDFGLNEPPIEREPCAYDNDSRAPRTRAIEMDSIAAHIDQLAQRCGRGLSR